MAEAVMCFVIYFVVASIMIGIGRAQLKSKTPVTFYAGEKPLDAKELSDVSEWNRKHGLMWITYGIIIIISGLTGGLFAGDDSLWCLLPMGGGVIAPLIGMIWYHGQLIRRYKCPVKPEKQ